MVPLGWKNTYLSVFSSLHIFHRQPFCWLVWMLCHFIQYFQPELLFPSAAVRWEVSNSDVSPPSSLGQGAANLFSGFGSNRISNWRPLIINILHICLSEYTGAYLLNLSSTIRCAKFCVTNLAGYWLKLQMWMTVMCVMHCLESNRAPNWKFSAAELLRSDSPAGLYSSCRRNCCICGNIK